MDALIILFVTGLVTLFASFAKKPALVLGVAVVGLLIALASQYCQLVYGHSMVHISYEGLRFDVFAISFGMVSTLFALLIIAAGYMRFKEEIEHTGEYVSLLIFSLTGALIMTAFTDMFMFFLGLEILSIPIYVMAGSRKQDIRSNEAAIKYFLMGAFATGLLLFGIAWLYGATGSFKLAEIGAMIAAGQASGSMLMIAILLILSSFIFKVGAAPFHFWSPDVYDGSPHAVTGFMASVVKMAAFGAFLKLFVNCFATEELINFWGPALAVLTIITLFIGNLSALRQTRFKRLLAYSSITHVGYTLLVILAIQPASIFTADLMNLGNAWNLWFYMTAYGFSVIALITVGIVLNDEEDRIDAFKGLARRNPFLAIVTFVAVLSLAGVPITAGFFGKYMVFSAAWSNYWWLVIIALINSAISIYYYLRLIGVAMSREDDAPADKISLKPLTVIVLLVCLAAMLGLGFATSCLMA